jgi:hypothetical protein
VANVRTTRAYLAGLGTAGSIVVGAALLFVLASAIVAFRGWPSGGGSDAPAQLVLSAPARSPTPVARRLVALVASAPRARVGSAARTPATAVVHARRSTVAGTGVGGSGLDGSGIGGPPTIQPTRPAPTTPPNQPPTTTAPGRTTTNPAPPTTNPAPPTTTPAPPTTNPAPPTTTPAPPTRGGGTSTPVGTVIKTVTGTVGDTVAGTGAGVGTIVKQVTAPVGGPVSTVGSGAGDTITKVTGTIGDVLGGG